MLSMIMLFLSVVAISTYYFMYSTQDTLSTLLYIAILFLYVLGIWKGSLLGLGVSLVYIFILGSYYFWYQWRVETTIQVEQSDEISTAFSITDMMIWQIRGIMLL
jgi:hypothetical protein